MTKSLIFWHHIVTLASMRRYYRMDEGHAMRGSCLRYGSGMLVWIALSWGCAAVPPCSQPEGLTAPASSINLSSAALQQKVKAQEKRISELSTQLQMLKRIDQDQQRQR